MHGIVEELRREVENLKKLLFNIVKVGTIVSVNEKEATARVEFKDRDGKVSAEIPFSFMHTLGDRTYSIPKVGQQVWCIFLPNAEDYGLIIGSNYNAKDRPPASDKNLFVHEFEDGTRIEYDKSSGKLTIENPKEVVLKVQSSINEETQTLQIKASSKSNLDTPTFTIKGDVLIQGNLMVMGNINSVGQTTAQGGLKTSPQGMAIFVDDLITKYNTHTHTDSQGGSTSMPNNQLP